MRQATRQTGYESLNRSSAAVFTTKVNSERMLMQAQLMSTCAAPICRKRVGAHAIIEHVEIIEV